MDGIFITMEGPDGAGKTSALLEISKRLKERTERVILTTREPGGSPIAEQIRSVILDPTHIEMDERTEALLYAASRRQHLVERVLPVLEQGGVVLCDRFVDSSIAYQGVARGIGAKEIAELNQFATNGIDPHLTLYIDIEPEVGLARIAKSDGNREINRLDKEKLSFHQRVRSGYLDLVKEHPERIVVIDGNGTPEEVVAQCLEQIEKRFPILFEKGEIV